MSTSLPQSESKERKVNFDNRIYVAPSNQITRCDGVGGEEGCSVVLLHLFVGYNLQSSGRSLTGRNALWG